MAPWLDEYMAALEARDAIEKANHDVYSAYARLAERTASLNPPTTNAETEPGNPATIPAIRPSGIKTAAPPPAPPSNASLATNLSAAQSARAALQTQLNNLQTSHNNTLAQHNSLRATHDRLTAHDTSLQIRLRDRDSEIRGKNKLLEDLQDELATTEMELTVKNEQMEKLKDENRHLVERWMKRVGEEADEMNVALETGERRRRRSKGTQEEASDKT